MRERLDVIAERLGFVCPIDPMSEAWLEAFRQWFSERQITISVNYVNVPPSEIPDIGETVGINGYCVRVDYWKGVKGGEMPPHDHVVYSDKNDGFPTLISGLAEGLHKAAERYGLIKLEEQKG